MISRDTIAQILEEIALLLELKGENPFKTRAYRNGAEVVNGYPGDIVELAQNSQLAGIKGIGAALAQKIHELVSTGKLEYYENLRKEFPPTLFELFDVQGLGPKKIKTLYEELGVASIEDLKRVCLSGEAAKLSRFGAKTSAKILESLAYRDQNAERFLLSEVAPWVELILDRLRAHPATLQCSAAGSYRRGKETVHDLDFIAATSDPQALMNDFTSQGFVASIVNHGPTKSTIRLENGVSCDLRAVSNDEFPFALNYFTGSKEHNVVMRGRARDQGYTLNEYRLAPLSDKTPEAPLIRTEEDLYRVLNLSYVEPALRENGGEFDLKEGESLPTLIKIENLRGTFHNHTTASDGKNTLEEMAEAARELGLEYLGIADHSKSSFQANGLSEERLLSQRDAIQKLNAGYKKFRLFAGIECDILRDGSLDFEDEILAQMDYVVASVHSVFTLSETEQTARILRAVENPYVTMIGHLTGRLLLRREPYAVNVQKIIDACAANGTWIELNAHPRRLDMDWRWWRMARDKGVKCVINPDAHSTAALQHLYFGVQIARKGWLERSDVMNCLPLTKIEKALSSKRKQP